MSTPNVSRPDFAKESAVGKPIRPIPTTQTFNFRDSNDRLTFSGSFMLIFKLDIISQI